MNFEQIAVCSVENGLGMRVSLYVSGCKFHCKNCFNPETWDFHHGNLFTTETAKIIKENLSLPYISGLSLLGGDPLWQDNQGIEQLIELAEFTQSINKDVWMWTGFLWEDIFNNKENILKQELVKKCSVVVDSLYEDTKKDLSIAFRGSKNQRIIDVKKSLAKNKVITLNEKFDFL